MPLGLLLAVEEIVPQEIEVAIGQRELVVDRYNDHSREALRDELLSCVLKWGETASGLAQFPQGGGGRGAGGVRKNRFGTKGVFCPALWTK